MKVVIVGAGFGGVRAALNLANESGFEVKLISDKTFFEYHAALYRSATGRSPLEVAIPLVEFFEFAKNIEIVNDKISEIDAQGFKLIGESGSNYKYDKAILAVGSITQYFGIEGLEEYSFGVKSINEALQLKRHIHETVLDPYSHEANYVVIGAGPTGVELAAEIGPYIKKIQRKHKSDDFNYKITLIEAAPRVLPALPEKFSRRVERQLHKQDVVLYTNTKIQGETAESLKLPKGEIKSRTVVWTAGVANNMLFFDNAEVFRFDARDKILNDQYLEAADNIFVIGDSASTPYSGMAQTALHDANSVTKNFIREHKNKSKKPYQPKIPVYAIPAGPYWSGVIWGPIETYGVGGWALRRLADLRLYINFLPNLKAFSTWRYGFIDADSCEICSR